MTVKPVVSISTAFQRTLPHRGVQWRRNFFNFPGFSSADSVLHNGSETQSYHERKIFPYRNRELYNVIADVESYSNFVPYCIGSRVLKSNTQPDGLTVMEAELTVGFLAFKESYVSTVTCKPNESVEAVASSSSPLFKTLTTVWRLHPVSSTSPQVSGSTLLSRETCAGNFTSRSCFDSGATLVTLDLSFAFANSVHATVSTAFFGQVSKLMVKAFEQRCVALYGPRTS